MLSGHWDILGILEDQEYRVIDVSLVIFGRVGKEPFLVVFVATILQRQLQLGLSV